MVYLVRRVEMTSGGEIIREGSRRKRVITPTTYRVGALVFFSPGKLYRVEEDVTPPEVREDDEKEEEEEEGGQP